MALQTSPSPHHGHLAESGPVVAHETPYWPPYAYAETHSLHRSLKLSFLLGAHICRCMCQVC